MTSNVERLTWKYLWDFLIEMSGKELKELPDITVIVWNEQSAWWALELLSLEREVTWSGGLKSDVLHGTLMWWGEREREQNTHLVFFLVCDHI